ncbi:uncharacterized protein LY89DRAFT_772794 [Mollisia scopiformis]|uniref:Zn(2)-C6 fungal-type domain-containing protein n=1 Tax=Mollisia scopiformis TaxID=149040 RepID=A0A194XIQ6_MOLSC|nr:uncharacterized protein LY89DRAFT_772794 [Mollisia scopiformis]KUJ20016.1 hypothetical protein LY89DRAFT_772794 [Mollisia scopiformis]
MVHFGGKPSTGCESCRARKIKCDQKPGGCVNCEKKGYGCSGYRDEIDLRFRHESQHVAQKSRDREARRKASRSPLPGSSASSSSANTSRPPEFSQSKSGNSSASMLDTRRALGDDLISSQQDSFLPDPALSYVLSPNLDDQALAFFFSNHVIGEWRASYRANLNSYGMDDALFAAVKAVGLAGISGHAHTPDMSVEARKRYLAAIQSVNNAIVFPESAKRDSTLVSIMLLSQIEALECSAPRSLTAWENHVKGAAAVLKLRGAEKLTTPLEVRLFVQAVSGLIVCCLKNRIHLPDHLFELRDVAGQCMQTNAPGWRMFHMHMLVTQFAADIKHKILTDPQSIISRALELDEMVSLIFLDSGPEWTFETIYDDSHPEIILLGHYYVYKTFMSAEVWNGMRSTRVLLHDQIRSTLLKGFATQPPLFSDEIYAVQFQASTDILYEMQNGLLASIPQQFLVMPTSSNAPFRFPWSNFQPDIYNPSQNSSPVLERIPLMRNVGGYLLPWLLYRTGNMSITKKETLDAILRLLRLAGSEMGIQMAFVLAEHLEAKFAAATDH